MASRTRPRRDYRPKHSQAKNAASKHAQPTKGFFRRFWWLFIVVPLALILLVVGSLVFAYVRIELPRRLPPIRTSFVYDREGNLLTTLHGAVDRTPVGLGRMSPHLIDAVLSVEDSKFYEHRGFDPLGIMRAAYTDVVKHETVQGASTITQQLIKQVYAGDYVEHPDGTVEYVLPPRTIKEKIREVLLSVKLEQKFSKDEILASYLNTVYFGHGAYGVEAAAQTYFGVRAEDLTISQSAVLAGTLHAPELYDPIDRPYDNKFRRDYAFDRMVLFGHLDDDRARELKARPCCSIPERILDREAGQKLSTPYRSEYFVDYVRQALIDQYGGGRVYGGGLRVTTSIDMDLQKAAEESLFENLPPTPGNPSASLVSIDVQTGQVLAMVGGSNFRKTQLNLATFKGGTGRPAGSAFKPFTLAAAMEAGYSLSSYWSGPSTITIEDPVCSGPDGPWQPVNAGDSGSGTYSLLSATTHSVNTVYAQVIASLGPETVVEMAHRLGIRSRLDPFCSVTLGSVATNPLEMTDAYATLANQGVRHRASGIMSVSTRFQDLYTNDGPGKQVVDPNIANLVSYALETVVQSGTGSSASMYPYPVAGKTGSADSNTDAWFCGYTVDIATCVWIGYPESLKPLLDVEGVPAVYGGTIPAAIWHDYMTSAMEIGGFEPQEFPTPSFENQTVFPDVAVPPPAPSPSPSPTPSPSPSPSPTPSPSPSPSPTETPSPSPTESPDPIPRRRPEIVRRR